MTSLMQSQPLFYYVVQSPYTKVINFMRCVECLGNTYKYSHSPKKQSQTFFDHWGLISKIAVQIFCGFSVALRSPFLDWVQLGALPVCRFQFRPNSNQTERPPRKISREKRRSSRPPLPFYTRPTYHPAKHNPVNQPRANPYK